MGTSVYLAVALDTSHQVDDGLCQHSVERSYSFDSTVIPLQILLGENIGLESRAQAKRGAARLPAFRRAEVDFSGISDIGHGFADDLFRVFERQHPLLQLVPVGMALRVSSMIESVRTTARHALFRCRNILQESAFIAVLYLQPFDYYDVY